MGMNNYANEADAEAPTATEAPTETTAVEATPVEVKVEGTKTENVES